MTNDEKDFEQMNRLFAEKIMGWEWDPTWGRCGWYDVGNPNKCQAIMHTFFPCTSIADAWMGVKKLSSEFWRFVFYYQDGKAMAEWHDVREDCEMMLHDTVAEREMSLAIVKACLKSKEPSYEIN